MQHPIIQHLLTHRRALDALNALSLLEEYHAKRTLTELALEYCRQENLPERTSAPISLRSLFTRYQGTLSPEQDRYLARHRWVAKFVCGRLGESRLADTVRREEIEALLSKYESPTSYNSIACCIRAVFRWGMRQKLLGESTVGALTLQRIPWQEPAYFLPDKVERIFRAAECAPDNAPDRSWQRAAVRLLALGFFAGVRTAEIVRARREDVDLDGAILRIPKPKGHTHGMRPRLVELEANAVAWLRAWWDEPDAAPSDPVVPDFWRFTQWKKRHLEPLGLSWGNVEAHNVMRHTYATMHVGAFRNPSATALNLGHGHTSDMLEKHYRGLVPQATARPYWSIFPVAPAHTKTLEDRTTMR